MPEGENSQVANAQPPAQANTAPAPALNGVKCETPAQKPAQNTEAKAAPGPNQPADSKPHPYSHAQNQKPNQRAVQNNRPNQAQNGQNRNQPMKRFNPVGGHKNQPEAPVGEKKFTGRCRLFVGNLPADINEKEFRELFARFGDLGEIFLNTQRSFGFVKLDTRLNAEHAKQELDGHTFKGRCIRVRFASHGAAVRVKNLSPYVSNEYLEQAFSMFGRVERAVVIVDDKGRSIGEGIVEFERKPSATQCINKCTENCFVLTSYPKPVIVEPLEQKDDEDGLPEKSINKNQQFYADRESVPHFAANNSLELEMALKWRDLYELEKQIKEEGLKKVQEAREQLEHDIEFRLIDYKEQKIKEDLRAKQEELLRIEDMRKNEFQRRKDMDGAGK
ncbi:Splicing proline- and glutamine [Brachionus plicatilis]|uniref:Splicing proline-and glutamine n=1 Tax=Brachionus plicatilis TaxID=10195 RepID=A0A3M7SYZ2_BRAPC|nr:Splicing proline- and glutamine [Brachionus plicatilis]